MPPRIINDVTPTSVICEKNTLCALSCYATSDSPASYSWTKNGEDPINDDIKVINNTFVFTPRSAQDYGVYVCNASNSFGSTTYEITLIEDRKSAITTTAKRDESKGILQLLVCLNICLLTLY